MIIYIYIYISPYIWKPGSGAHVGKHPGISRIRGVRDRSGGHRSTSSLCLQNKLRVASAKLRPRSAPGSPADRLSLYFSVHFWMHF